MVIGMSKKHTKYIRRKKSTRKQSRLSSFVLAVAVTICCVFIVTKVADYRAESKELAKEEQALEQALAEAELEKEELTAMEQYMHTNQYIEDVAKEKFGLVYPDEIIIKPAE